MSVVTTDLPHRPRLVFRVGITGARCLRADQRTRILDELKSVLSHTCSALAKLESQECVHAFYVKPAKGNNASCVRLISPLAKGADRLAATAAYALKLPVDVPMPFPQSVYETDFRGSQNNCPDETPLTPEQDLAEFHGLLDQCSGKVMLDGARNDPEQRGGDLFEGQSYEAVGRYVVRHCDLLLAVWDGRASSGRGGSQEIVEYATLAGVPVWWIHSTQEEAPRWISDPLDLLTTPDSGVTALDKLRLHLSRLIPAPPAPSRRHRTTLVKLATWGRNGESTPAQVYFSQRRLPSRRLWGTYKWFMKLVMGSVRRAGSASESAASAIFASDAPAYYHHLYEEADSRAGDFIVRYRSSYVLIITLGAFALVVGEVAEIAKGFLSRSIWIAALPEVILLALAAALLIFSVRQDWHLKSIEYRLLAELLRKQKTLATLGWALPVSGVERLADTEGLTWIAWLFSAFQRASPFPHCEIDTIGNTIVRVEELRNLLDEQIVYHQQRQDTASRAAENLERLGGISFLGLVAVSIVNIWAFGNDQHSLELVLSLLQGILPAISAAFLAIRSYSELQLLAEQSSSMSADLKRAKHRLDRLDILRPLASQALGKEAAAVSTLMLRDLEGWGRVFLGKLLETP